ncbi:hypothetical protein GL267_008715 [Acidithiobacillus ferrianus]|uniref:Uncharacterized protein n=2 Tax=Acidithiobacillus ferrianus TaxID=2678518 RepID=A0A845UPL4_9PROT|nr:hypothetical protein [Acidithiobacillus ferrianus]NDU43478.1 hypothetical protein [Acidithiobacillus ferrianus]
MNYNSGETCTAPTYAQFSAGKAILEAENSTTGGTRIQWGEFQGIPSTLQAKTELWDAKALLAQIIEIPSSSATDPIYLDWRKPASWQAIGDTSIGKPLLTGRKRAAIALLRKWRSDESDAQEQRQTLDYLKQSLDQDRFSDRKLFP